MTFSAQALARIEADIKAADQFHAGINKIVSDAIEDQAFINLQRAYARGKRAQATECRIKSRQAFGAGNNEKGRELIGMAARFAADAAINDQLAHHAAQQAAAKFGGC